MHPITIGTCGWSYKDWAGNFYPEKAPAGDYLGYYAEKFPIVEVDSTFYRSPSLRMVEGWAEKTPESFKFSLKVPQTITHEKLLVACESEVGRFVEAIAPLGDKLLCCVLQFSYLNKKKIAGQSAFLERLAPFLDAWPDSVPLAVEVRNKTWMNGKLADCLRSRNIVWVLPDQAWMPNPLEIVEKLDPVTGPFGYVRLLGDRKAVDDATDRMDRIVIDRTEELRKTARAIAGMAQRVPVVAYTNNHYAGHGPETARQLRVAVEEFQ